MKTKRLIYLVLLFLSSPVVQAQFTYIVTNGTVTVTGYTNSDSSVTVPTNIDGLPVTSIARGAFDAKSVIISVAISDTVTNIGDSAFAGCENLASISLGNGVGSIGVNAFGGCHSLTNIILPDSVTNIAGAFSGCFGLTNVTIGRGLAIIGGQAFFDCHNLASVTIPGTVNTIGEAAFENCGNLTNLTICNGVASIGEFAFELCSSLASVVFPGSVTNIGDYGLVACSNLTGAYFEGNAPSGGDWTFFDGDFLVKVYTLPGTTGWDDSPEIGSGPPTFQNYPIEPWVLPYPVILGFGPSFGVQTNQFGFIVSWATNSAVVVQACTDLANPVWQSLSTNALTNGTYYFSDANWTNYPARFYRVTTPE